MAFKSYFTLITIILNGFIIQAQQDTLWFNSTWRKTTKAKAKYFRPTPKEVKGLYHLKDYHINGTLQMEAYSSSPKQDIFEGKVIWYYKDGRIKQTANYKHNLLHGDLTSYYQGKSYTATYKNDRIFEGKVFYNSKSNGNSLQEYKNGYHTKLTYFFKSKPNQPMSVLHYEIVGVRDAYSRIVGIDYFDKKGKKIGSLKYLNENPHQGTKVFRTHKNSEAISTIEYYDNGKLSYSDNFYANQQPKSKTLIDKNGNKSKTYYKPNGNSIGTINYIANRENEGQVVNFYSNYNNQHPEGAVKFISFYERGTNLKTHYFYPNGQLKKVILYDSETKSISSEEAYDVKGKFLGKLRYKKFAPFEGIKLGANKKSWYSKGKITKEITYYKDSQHVLSEQVFDTVTYFNRQNKPIGKLVIDTSKTYHDPLTGIKFVENNYNTLNQFLYENGSNIQETYFTNNYKDKTLYKTVIDYAKNQGLYGKKIKETKFYSNGNKQSVKYYASNYKETKAEFYNLNGEQIAQMDYKTKNGTDYKFFYNSKQPETITQWQNGTLVAEKKYKRVYDYRTDPYTEDYVLVKNLNTNSKALHYNTKGDTLFSLTYKHQKPYEGIYFDDVNNTAYTFKNGVKDGRFSRYRSYKIPYVLIEEGQYNAGKKNGVFKTYNHNVLKKTETYVNDLLDGPASFFEKGKKIASIIYKNNKPFEGVLIEKHLQKTYKNGVLTHKIEYSETGDIHSVYKNNMIEQTVYYPQSKNKKYVFSSLVNDYNLQGTITRYNKKGKATHKAELSDGSIVSGELWILPKSHYDFPNVRYFKLIKTKTSQRIQFIGKDDEILAEINESLTLKTSLLDRLYLQFNHLDAARLY